MFPKKWNYLAEWVMSMPPNNAMHTVWFEHFFIILFDYRDIQTFYILWLILLIYNWSLAPYIYSYKLRYVSIRLKKIYGWIIFYLLLLWNNLWYVSRNIRWVHENSLCFSIVFPVSYFSRNMRMLITWHA